MKVSFKNSMIKLRFYISVILVFIVQSTALADAKLPYPEENLISYKASEPKASLLVYTDVNCGFCRKLHKEVPHLNASGISVYYAPYPRAGLKSKSRKIFNSIYCSDNRQLALSKAKNDFILDKGDCVAPIDEIFESVKGKIRGTPTILTSNSETIAGYRSAKELAENLGVQYVSATEQALADFAPLNYINQEIKPSYYQGLSRVALYQQPSHEQKKVWSLNKNSVRVATIKTVVDGEEWVGFENKGRIYYGPSKQMTLLGEAKEYDIVNIAPTKYATAELAKVFLHPDITSKVVTNIPPRRSIKVSFEYQTDEVKWIGYERNGVPHFLEPEKFSLDQ